MRWTVALCFALMVVALAWLGIEFANNLLRDPEAERVRTVVDTHLPPYSSVGRVLGSRTCTGALVLHPRIVVTAAHCVVETDDTLRKDTVSFQLAGQLGTGLATFRGRVTLVGSTRQYAGHTVQDEPLDWAIIVLDKAPPNTRPLLLRSLNRSELRAMGGRISLPAYSIKAAEGKAMAIDKSCSIFDIRWGVFIHDCEGSKGSSGAPLLVDASEGFAVVGIHSASLHVPGKNDWPADFVGAAVRSSSFESAVMAVRDRLAQK
ncbi:MAG: trypsin-like serine peptidase [Candidatus Entotheonellia bacterium]